MKWWPFGRSEHRESYTDAIVAGIIARANGSAAAVAGATAALETASSHVGRAFAAAVVDGPAFAREVLTPASLMLIGRELIRRGETVLAIDVGTRSLLPATSWDIHGEPDPMTWSYRATVASPSYTVTRNMPGAGVIHCRYAVEPSRPWCGLGPVQVASLAGQLSASLAASLTEEAGTTTGYVLPLPVGGDDPTVVTLKADLRTSAGALHLVESTQSMHAGAPGSAPSTDWKPQRLGPNPPAAEVALFTAANLEVLAACGVPPSLAASGAEGTAQREAFRRFLHLCVAPLARLVEAELSDKLDGDVSLSFDGLFAGDLSGRARAFQSLVGGGMDPGKAAGLAGLMESE